MQLFIRLAVIRVQESERVDWFVMITGFSSRYTMAFFFLDLAQTNSLCKHHKGEGPSQQEIIF